MASWLVHSGANAQARARDFVLCSWARQFTLTVPLSTQVYKYIPANLLLGGNPVMDYMKKYF